ncbi:MAG: branched-chain amino acid ABC transporter permease, partial [Pseudomonadota bacterium]
MALLGGKGTLWGPVLGAALFHIIKEITWTYLLGWQWVTLGALIIVNVIFFQQGILGWAMEKWPAFFGITVEEDLEVERETDGKSAPASVAP